MYFVLFLCLSECMYAQRPGEGVGPLGITVGVSFPMWELALNYDPHDWAAGILNHWAVSVVRYLGPRSNSCFQICVFLFYISGNLGNYNSQFTHFFLQLCPNCYLIYPQNLKFQHSIFFFLENFIFVLSQVLFILYFYLLFLSFSFISLKQLNLLCTMSGNYNIWSCWSCFCCGLGPCGSSVFNGDC